MPNQKETAMKVSNLLGNDSTAKQGRTKPAGIWPTGSFPTNEK
ncbi:hypothetical protein ART_2621 [Arthrobacter sp. PAMC 25486]|nr:hypothetical protein ART_2621 [Arthrobacter sp. PAMC 25486]